jgi:hypothetical protein
MGGKPPPRELGAGKVGTGGNLLAIPHSVGLADGTIFPLDAQSDGT